MQRSNWKKNTLIILYNHGICVFTKQTIYPFRHRDKTNSNSRFLLFAEAFSDFFSHWCSLLEFQHRGGLFQPLCVWVSHVARRCRFASCKLLNSARCIRASESGIRARSSLSSLRAFSRYGGSGELPKIECRVNLASVWHSLLRESPLMMALIIDSLSSSLQPFKHLKWSNN